MDESIIKKANTKKSLSDEIATRQRSLNFYSLCNILPDPDIVLRKQGKDIKIYRELLCDPHVTACVQSRKAGVLSLEWEIARGINKDKNIELLSNLLKKLDIYKLINDILDSVLWGFQPIEVIWEKSGNLILPTELKAKPTEWFCYDADNNLRFKTKQNYFGELLPPKKFLCPQYNASYDNPYGDRILSKVFWQVVFKKGGLKFWTIFTEKYGMPHIIGKHPRGASQEETNALADMLERMVQDAIAVIPDDSSVELKEANKSSSAEIYEKLIDKMNAEISKAIIGQTLTTEIGNTGSYAASNTHFQVRQDIIDSDKRLVEKTINQLLRWIYELNFSTEIVPEFELYEEEDIDLDLAQRDKTLSESGVKFTKKYFIKNYGLDEEDFDITQFQQTTQPVFSQFKEQENFQGQTQVDELFDLISNKELQNQSEKILSPIIEMIMNGNSYSEIKEALKDENLNTKDFEKVLQKALFLCEAEGRLDGLQ